MEILASVDHNWFAHLDDCLKMPPKKYQRLTQFLEKNKIGEERALRFMEYLLLLGKDPGVVPNKVTIFMWAIVFDRYKKKVKSP